MRWFLHGPMTLAVSQALLRLGHTVQTAESVNFGPELTHQELLQQANKAQLDIMTTDAKLAAAPFEQGFWFQRCIVYLQLEGGDVEQDDAVDRLFERYKRLTPGRLYTVTENRVKVRQLPAKK